MADKEKGEKQLETEVSALQVLSVDEAQVQDVFARCKPDTVYCQKPTCRKTRIVISLE